MCSALQDHVILPLLSREAMTNCIPAGWGWESLLRCSPPCHISGRGRGSFGKDCVLLQILRVSSLPCSCCTGALSVKYRGHCFSPKPHHESVTAPRKAFIFSADKAVRFIPDSPLTPIPGAARTPASPCCGFIFSRC